MRMSSGSNWQRDTLRWEGLIHMQVAFRAHNVTILICRTKRRLGMQVPAGLATIDIMRDCFTIG